MNENGPDTGERIRRVYHYVDKEIEKSEKLLSGQLVGGFERVERALNRVTSDVAKTREEVAVVSTKVENIEKAAELDRQQDPLKEILKAIRKERLSIPPAVINARKALLLTGGGALGGGGLAAGLLKLVEWLQTLF